MNKKKWIYNKSAVKVENNHYRQVKMQKLSYTTGHEYHRV